MCKRPEMCRQEKVVFCVPFASSRGQPPTWPWTPSFSPLNLPDKYYDIPPLLFVYSRNTKRSVDFRFGRCMAEVELRRSRRKVLSRGVSKQCFQRENNRKCDWDPFGSVRGGSVSRAIHFHTVRCPRQQPKRSALPKPIYWIPEQPKAGSEHPLGQDLVFENYQIENNSVVGPSLGARVSQFQREGRAWARTALPLSCILHTITHPRATGSSPQHFTAGKLQTPKPASQSHCAT